MISTALARLRPAIAPKGAFNRAIYSTSRRMYASKSQPSPTSQFYRTFTRPIAKTLLIAVFSYQLAYWSWVKLETDEIRAERDATIEKLETTIKEYDAETKAKKD
ncbi:hypothetical protein NXS19_012578 [Fusarium pseudograminearum]|uniref:Uncharacterized protein n=1 Tax=Fusarium pseudograminearum (strain CS3096) TaxID=1028729 RepID=K3UFE7_FUSPC|nr:hypothetical protein FPSE_09380 [Fusarium pseudograminearum CS3096]EKJ70386.1 hypothetical protein FPSE_09380 [Fusarium pseudograminearum CS3096]KAF0639848.1 hypothetical protein FPSE5266_09380 [Fusarium pseudograminearum]UZP44766.1 hypothetical protein NXS19_012578 [Fusarium pseudograminearum]